VSYEYNLLTRGLFAHLPPSSLVCPVSLFFPMYTFSRLFHSAQTIIPHHIGLLSSSRLDTLVRPIRLFLILASDSPPHLWTFFSFSPLYGTTPLFTPAWRISISCFTFVPFSPILPVFFFRSCCPPPPP